MFDANHLHIEASLDITDSDKLSKHSSYFFTKTDMYSPKVVVTLLQVFPNIYMLLWYTSQSFCTDICSITRGQYENVGRYIPQLVNEPPHEKTYNLHMRKHRR